MIRSNLSQDVVRFFLTDCDITEIKHNNHNYLRITVYVLCFVSCRLNVKVEVNGVQVVYMFRSCLNMCCFNINMSHPYLFIFYHIFTDIVQRIGTGFCGPKNQRIGHY